MADAAGRVLGEEYRGVDPGGMLPRYLRRRTRAALDDARESFEELADPADISDYRRRLRERFVDAIGGFPERTPLEPTVADSFLREGYRVEAVRFASRPDHTVTATLFLPEANAHRPPYPGVVIACGHAPEGKANDMYQKAAALLARNGLAALVFDPVSQGERYQLRENGALRDGPPTRGHMQQAVGSIPLGRNVAGYEIWDGMRAIDYLQSREAVDGDRIGLTGNSGGGTQTAYVAALDDRVVAAAPACYITGFDALLAERSLAEDAEQNIHGQVAFGMDHADLLCMRAPAPTLVCTATDDFFPPSGAWAAARRATRLYGRLGYPERVGVAEVEAEHGFHRLLREAMARWMVRWLRGEDRVVTEPRDLGTIPEERVRATPDGQVLDLAGERTVYDLNAALETDLAAERAARWADGEPLGAVRGIVGVPADLPEPEVDRRGTDEREWGTVERLVLEPEDGIWLPAVRYAPDDAGDEPPVVCVHDDGIDAALDAADATVLAAEGRDVLAVDPRGIGETAVEGDDEFGPDASAALAAYRLGESFVGYRATDLLVAARWLHDATGTPPALHATGDVGIPALHAAALEPDAVAEARIEGALRSWSDLLDAPGHAEPFANLVHGALEVYDLPDLAAASDAITVTDARVP